MTLDMRSYTWGPELLPDDRSPYSSQWRGSIAVCGLMKKERLDDVEEFISYHRCAPSTLQCSTLRPGHCQGRLWHRACHALPTSLMQANCLSSLHDVSRLSRSTELLIIVDCSMCRCSWLFRSCLTAAHRLLHVNSCAESSRTESTTRLRQLGAWRAHRHSMDCVWTHLLIQASCFFIKSPHCGQAPFFSNFHDSPSVAPLASGVALHMARTAVCHVAEVVRTKVKADS